VHDQSVHDQSVHELKLAALLGAVFLLAVTAGMGSIQGWPLAGRFLLPSALLWAWAWQQAWRRRRLNYGDDPASPFPSLGWANRLTLLRGALIAATGGFLFLPVEVATGVLAWLPALFYGLAAVLDRMDGYLARRSHQTTRLGSELDTVYDALGLVVAPLLALGYGKVHWTYLLVSVAYYLFQAGLYWRHRHALPVAPLVPNLLRRTLAGSQMGFVALALWPPLQAELTRVAGLAFMVPLLAGFLYDWLAVSARIHPDRPPLALLLQRLAGFSSTILQPLVRLVLAVLLLVVADTAAAGLMASATTLAGEVFVQSLRICALLLAAGVAARIAASFALLLLAWLLPAASVIVLAEIALYSAVFVVLLGAGRFSLWQRDDDWINRHDGA